MKQHRILLICGIFFALLCGVPLAKRLAQSQDREINVRARNTAAPKRIALIIGNGKYDTTPLPNAPNDALQVASILRQLNFEVVVLTDRNKRQMKDALRDFGDSLSKTADGSVAWFFYAGHGIQVKGRNYLVPIGADVTNEAEAKDDCVNLELVLEQMSRTLNALNVVVLDACRNNPFRGWRSGGDGLAFVNAPRGTLIAYATSPGRTAADGTGKNSPYTAALLKCLPKANVSLLRMFELVREEVETTTRGNQTPWESTSVTNGSEFYLAGRTELPPPFDARQMELEFWNSVKTSRNSADLRAYLVKYPNGEFRSLAENRLADLTSEIKPPPKPGIGTTRQNSIGMQFTYIPAGSFQMGSTDADIQRVVNTTKATDKETTKDWFKDELPQRSVTISQPFYLGQHEVTQKQWQDVMGTTVQQQRDKKGTDYALSNIGPNQPMYFVSWEEAQEFIKRLNAKNDGFTYRLPTEAEWEYAARAGTTGDYAGNLDSMAWYADNSGNARRDSLAEWVKSGRDWQKYFDNFLKPNGNGTHEVGTKAPNPWGLFDMHGNVWEWCEDVYHDNYKGAPSDSSAWLSGGDSTLRVLRGGSWDLNGRGCRSADRDVFAPGDRGLNLGFRVVAVPRT